MTNSAANLIEADFSEDHNAPTIAGNKRKRVLDEHDEQGGDNGANEPTANHQNLNLNKNAKNKPRKKKRKGNNSQKHSKSSAHSTSQNKKAMKRKRNWIEDCSESITRIPSNCVAPLTCKITRVELDEDPLVPRHTLKSECDAPTQSDDVASDNPTKEAAGNECDTQAEKSPPNFCEKNEPTLESDGMPNIAFLSKNYPLVKSKTEPWEVVTSIQVGDEQKKLFIPVVRHASAIGPTRWLKKRKKNYQQSQQFLFHLPGGDNGDGIKNPYPKDAVPDKYWAQRKRLFSRYDEGIQIGGKDDPEMWYSITPESIANHVASRMVDLIQTNEDQGSATDTTSGANGDANCSVPSNEKNEKMHHEGSKKDIVIVDAFCGCGGNSIAFARINKAVSQVESAPVPSVKVIAVDNNLARLKMAANNAAVYGINKKDITFVHADAVEVLRCYNKGVKAAAVGSGCDESKRRLISGFDLVGIDFLPTRIDGIFLSPPWGGMSYEDEGRENGFDPISSILIRSQLEQIRTNVSIKKLSHEFESNQTDGVVEEVTTNGGELLSISVKSIFDDANKEGVVAYFLPRNTSGISIGQIAVSSGIDGCFEMEQNVVNGKVKTVTAYFGYSIAKN